MKKEEMNKSVKKEKTKKKEKYKLIENEKLKKIELVVSLIVGIINGTGVGEWLANTISPLASSLPGIT